MRSIIALCILVGCLVPRLGEACMTDWERYLLGGARDPLPRESLERHLRLAASCSHEPHATIDYEPGLVTALTRAVEEGLPKELIRSVFIKYRCAYSQRREQKYQELLSHLEAASVADLCDVRKLESLLYVTAEHGANLRESASTASPRVHAVPKHDLVLLVGSEGPWQRVRHGSYFEGYVHGSLLAPY